MKRRDINFLFFPSSLVPYKWSFVALSECETYQRMNRATLTCIIWSTLAWFVHREAFVWKLHNNTSRFPSTICLFTEVFWGGRQDNKHCCQGKRKRGMEYEEREREVMD